VALIFDKKKGLVAIIVAVLLPWPWTWSHAYKSGGGHVRQAAVAGLFYPRDPGELQKTVRKLLDEGAGAGVQGKIRALVCPHAGYVYSGVVAAAGYRHIDESIKTVILLGPSHRVPLKGPSVPDVAAYRTPLGDVPVAELASRFQGFPLVESVASAHEEEHSLEVQLPFLQVMLKDFDIVPILINGSDPEALASAIAPFVGKSTLVVASSDLSHYYAYDTARSLDTMCTNAITGAAFSEMALCEACGKDAVLTLMHLAELKGWTGRLIDYRNSGDTGGDKQRVVGYASIAYVDRKEISATMKDDLSPRDRKALLTLARTAIRARLFEGAEVKRPDISAPAMRQERGCFVTLHKDGQLRGCIGSIEPVSPLVECIEENALNAAFRDPRFPALSQEELSDIDIEVSVLTVPKNLVFKDGQDLKRQLDPLVHGVILSRGFKRATFLPQVWKQLPDKEEFLKHLCLKGGMPQTAWQDNKTEVKVYRAEVFGEEDVR
jgi:AmmeMemoRadiSam system protein B/AmmeMemoRadiSam system protein A